ncbi:polysaccharide biosynthesis protein [Alistipes shahii]|jgi:FlaA1/EpsC-like NDP-sugar epimerase|uniref:polysaccharide biosynthesis protein n=1 Tax=Alistipes shahii TaxID=328814 RepID=UPI0014593F26|nr:nucleoside-diphosphate sugar epimerase/dehydratase [Alistipes shahii]NMF23924.1 polysaccharide biosynthesis protein [Alistipes shahii]
MLYHLLSRLGAEKYLSLSYFSSRLILAIDTVVAVFSTFVAYLLVRGLFPHPIFTVWYGVWLLAGSCLLSVISFVLFRTFRSIIRYSTLREVWKLGAAVLLKDALMFGYVLMLPQNSAPSMAAIAMGFLLDVLVTLFLLLGLRLGMIAIYDLLKLKSARRNSCQRVLVYGTGDKAVALVTRLQNSPHYRVIGFLTYGKLLRNHTIADCPVYYFEDEDSIEYLRDRVDIDAILFATNDDAQDEQDRLIKYCTEKSVKILIAPPIDEVIGGKIMKQSIREIKIEDLLGRSEIKISMEEIVANFRGKTILVTGAAGSIGSELCRQLATFGIRELILYDNGETPMHNLRLELEERYPELKFIPVIGDVRIPARLDFVFRTYHPQVVFHAAAYKHVPLMEENPCEAVLVNVAGTRNVADKCIEYDAEKMVMISTDKAVNPTNVMGCTKRLAEIYVQSLGLSIEQGHTQGKTRFVTTRFGNVLGSNGSVIPRFREQIAKGGPVTVTHPDITRFFMTIPEACRLVMEAATMSTGNQIFVFDMGESVKIAHLARRMIELAGFEPDKDIKIEYTGLRPGEKLYEEVLSNKENTEPTLHDQIRIAKVREYDYREACEVAEELEALSRKVEIPDMVRLMKKTVPEFKSKNSRFEVYDKVYDKEKNAI